MDTFCDDLKVKKRDGRIVDFDVKKIQNAITATVIATGADINLPWLERSVDSVLRAINEDHKDNEPYDIERIQDHVERALIDNGAPDIAKNYILYRDSRTRARNVNSIVNRTITDLVMVDSKDLDAKRENANINGDSTMGAMLKIGGTITKEYNLNNLIKPEYAEMHREGIIHIHDLDFYALTINCLQIPLGKLLDSGFATGHGYLRTPSNIKSAATLACIAIQSNQNDMLGGQAIPTFDYDLAPYVAKSHIRNIWRYMETKFTTAIYERRDEFIRDLERFYKENGTVLDMKARAYIDNKVLNFLRDVGHYQADISEMPRMNNFALAETYNDTFQAMEATVHNLCTLNSRAGGQVPFSSVNFGTCTSEEGRIVSESLLKAIERGLGNGETAIFPIAIFKMKKGITDKGSVNYDLYKFACRVSAKRLFPNFENLDAPYNLKYYKEGHPETEIATMGAIARGKVTLYAPNGVYDFDISNGDEFIRRYALAYTDKCKVFDLNTAYLELKEGVKIYDSIKGCLTNVKKWMCFKTTPETKWLRIRGDIYAYNVNGDNIWSTVDHNEGSDDKRLDADDKVGYCNGNYIDVTDDHPLPVYTGERKDMRKKLHNRTLARDVVPGMEIPISTEIAIKLREDATGIGPQIPGTYYYLRVTNVEAIKPEDAPVFGYDFETESDRFDVGWIVSHNCRTRTIGNIHDPEHQQVTGRGNLFFTTLNLPYLALEAKAEGEDGLYDRFMEAADAKIDEIVDLSLDRMKFVGNRKARNYPFLMGQKLYIGSENLGPDDKIYDVIKQGSMTVGFIGLAETLKVLLGKHHGESAEAQKVGLGIIKHMSDRMKEISQKTKLNFALMGSPAEGCAGRLLRLTRAHFGIIKGVTDHEYLTNSFHVPVYHSISAWDKIQLEAPYHEYCDGGCISYIELTEDATKNIKGFEALVTAMADAGMNYFAINHPVDRDPVCGYVGYFPDGICPRCGRREGEGVPVEKLLSLKSYSPDPEYAVRYSDLEQDEIVPNESDPK